MSLERHSAADRKIEISETFDLAKTAAPVWWARGRWPSADWRDGNLHWIGWEGGNVVVRSIRQKPPGLLVISGSDDRGLDRDWAARVLGIENVMPSFTDATLAGLARKHCGLHPWSAGSLFQGFVSAVVGQSISLAAAAVTEQRLFSRFNAGVELAGRTFWPPPRPEQLADASPAFIREAGVTQKRAEALRTIGSAFAHGSARDITVNASDIVDEAEKLLAISGVGPWTVKSALLWGVAHPDAHPTGDVALLRAARLHFPGVVDLRALDRMSDDWKPWRGWAARLLWLDLMGFAPAGASDRTSPVPHDTHNISPERSSCIDRH